MLDTPWVSTSSSLLSKALRSAAWNSGVPGWAERRATGMAACKRMPASIACAPKVATLPAPFAAS